MQKAELLNTFCSSIFTSENLNVLTEIDDLHYEHPLSSVCITSDIVFNKLSALKSNKSPGPNGLNPLVIKEAAVQLCIPLSILFRKSFDKGHLPDDWKRANIVPVFKKGESSDPGNYRPISLTSIVYKVFEAIVREDIIKHLISNNLLSYSSMVSCQRGHVQFSFSQLWNTGLIIFNKVIQLMSYTSILRRHLINCPMKDFLLS